MKIYFNLVEDNEGIFDFKKLVIFSSGKDYSSTGYNESDLDRISLPLKKEMDGIYSYDDSKITESQLLFELKTKGFERSEVLELFSEDDEELKNLNISKKNIEKELICSNCGTKYTQRQMRNDLPFMGDCYICECGEEISTEDFLEALELKENEVRCPDCGVILDISEFEVNEDIYTCKSCDTSFTIENKNEESKVELEEVVESKIEETTEVEIEEEDDETTSSTSVSEEESTEMPTVVEIKDWNDLIGNIDYAYSFLKNYVSISKKGFNATIIDKRNLFKNSDLLNVLEENGIITNEYRLNRISKFYTEDAIINSSKSGSIDNIGSFVVLAMGCVEEVANNLSTIYTSSVDTFNHLYLYWNALLMAKDIKYCKPMFKNAMATIDKELKTTKPLFSFNIVDVQEDIKNFKVVFSEENSSTTKVEIEDISAESVEAKYYWEIVDIPYAGINKKYISIKNIDTNASEVSSNITKALAIRGVNVSTAPTFEIPGYVCLNDVSLLLSGIPGLVKKN